MLSVLAAQEEVDAVTDKAWILPAASAALLLLYALVGLVVVVVIQTRNASLWRRRHDYLLAMGRPGATRPVRERRYLASAGRRSPRRVDTRWTHQSTVVIPRVRAEETVEIKPGGVR